MHYTAVNYRDPDEPSVTDVGYDVWRKWIDDNPDRALRKRMVIDGDQVVEQSIDFIEGPFHYEALTDDFEKFAMRLERYPPDALILSARDTEAPYHGPRDTSEYTAVAQNILTLDIDGMPFLDGFTRDDLLTQPRRVFEAHVPHILFGIDCDWIAVPSSSCCFVSKGKPVLRFHLHVRLDKYYSVDALHRITDEFLSVHPFVDGAMKSHGQLLITKRPALNVEDPFKRRRAFYHRGKEASCLAFKDGREHYVPATLPATRGTSSEGLYRIKEDRVAGHHHISEEALNFTMSLKSKFPEMTWADAYPYVWDALEKAGATTETWKRLSEERDRDNLGHAWSLSVAARLFKNASPNGQRTIHAAPAYVEPEITAQAAYDELARAVKRADIGEHLFVVPTGVGKTELITRHVSENPEKQVVILTTNHERCDELRDRLETAQQDEIEKFTWETYPTMDEQRESSLFRTWQVWQGRMRLCGRPEDVQRVQRAHLNVYENLCTSCPMRDACGYMTQMRSTWAHNWIAPVAMVTNNVRILNEADTIIIDEGVVDQLIGGRHFDLSELRVDRGGERLMQLSDKALRQLVDKGDVMSNEELEEALELERALHPHVYADGAMTSEEIEKSTNMDGYHSNLVSLWRAMMGGANAVHTYQLTEEVDGQTVVRDMCRTSYKRSTRFAEKNVLIFDATPNETAVRAHFPDVQVHEFEARVQNVHVRQVIDNRGVNGEFLNTMPKPSEGKDSTKWEAKETQKREKRDKFVAWLKVQPGRTVVICKKALREHFEAYALPNVAFGHHGAIEGQDVWTFGDDDVKGAEIDNLVIVGRNLPPTWEIEAIARQHHCDDDELVTVCTPKDGQKMPWYDEDYKVIAGGVAGRVPVHPDPRANAVVENIWKHGLEQAFGRGRGARRARRLRVVLFHNMPIDVTVHEAVRKSQVAATVGDVTLLSPKEIERVFGYSGQYIRRMEIAPTHKYWTREGQKTPWTAAVTDGVDAANALRVLGALRIAEA